MNFSITESQKRLLTFLVSVLICVGMYTMMIQPTQTKLEALRINEETVKQEVEAFKLVANDVTAEARYLDLLAESQISFEENYESFKANEVIEEILAAEGIAITSLQIGEYAPIDDGTYEAKVVQPDTPEEQTQMVTMMNNPVLMELLLKSTMRFTVDASNDQHLELIDAINNVAPVAPGEASPSRYCMEVVNTYYDKYSDADYLSFEVNFYGMVPPPEEDVQVSEE